MVDMQEYEVADKSYDKESGELTQFLVFWQNGEPELKRASAENILLFDPENKLPFENGLYDFLNGQEALQLSDDPEVLIAPTSNEYAYMLRVKGNTVETTPNQAEDILEGVKDAAIDGVIDNIIDVYDDIMSSQVRQHVINALEGTFEENERITIVANGWLVDGHYLVDWSASMYTKDDDPEEGDYMRGGGGVVQKDESYEFVEFRGNREIEPVEVTINGDTYRLSEREMLFLTKIKWLLNRRHYHPDNPFWMWNDKYADVDAETGEPESGDEGTEEPDIDNMNL